MLKASSFELPGEIELAFNSTIHEIRCAWPKIFMEDKTSLDIKKDIKNFIGNYGRQTVNLKYEKYALAFNQAFFFKNFYKSLVALSHLKKEGFETDLPVIDVGCGAGVFSIAWNIVFGINKNHIALIDKSKAQLTFAKKIAQILNFNKVEFCHGSFLEDFSTMNGLRLFSYWFCEQDISRLNDPKTLENIVGDGAIFIDYRMVINSLQSIFANEEYSLYRFDLGVRPRPHTCSLLKEENINVHGGYCKRR